MNCVCHGEPAYWNKDERKTTGGYWRCAVSKRAQERRTYRAQRAAITARRRARYDTDPIYRIGKNLHDHARRRRQTIARRRVAHEQEG